VQVVIALVLTPEGFPLAYESCRATPATRPPCAIFLRKIETQYGRAERIWVMDRGIPTEEVLAEMRASIRRFIIWWARPKRGSGN